jgi:U3 small nucleolar RNA-associated protein 10
LLLTFLPHHAESLYSRLLQIITLPPNFAFLSQYTDIRKASKLPPVPRQLFVRAISRDPLFLETYFTFTVARVKSGHGYPAMVKKWIGFTAEAILQMRQARISEEIIVSRIMPFIAQGLGMKQNTEFQIGNYTILTLIASNRTLTDKVVNAAMEAICQGWTADSKRCGILCLVTLAQHRNRNDVLSGAVLQTLISIK